MLVANFDRWENGAEIGVPGENGVQWVLPVYDGRHAWEFTMPNNRREFIILGSIYDGRIPGRRAIPYNVRMMLAAIAVGSKHGYGLAVSDWAGKVGDWLRANATNMEMR